MPGQSVSCTHGVEEHGQEQFTPVDDLVQLTGATWVLVVENGVCEEATGLPGEYLHQETGMDGAPMAITGAGLEATTRII